LTAEADALQPWPLCVRLDAGKHTPVLRTQAQLASVPRQVCPTVHVTTAPASSASPAHQPCACQRLACRRHSYMHPALRKLSRRVHRSRIHRITCKARDPLRHVGCGRRLYHWFWNALLHSRSGRDAGDPASTAAGTRCWRSLVGVLDLSVVGTEASCNELGEALFSFVLC
jgi:hypothetical protein